MARRCECVDGETESDEVNDFPSSLAMNDAYQREREKLSTHRPPRTRIIQRLTHTSNCGGCIRAIAMKR